MIATRRICKADLHWFRELCLSEIGRDYDDIDESFANNILRADRERHDPWGYFTISKQVWVGETSGRRFGFIVTTRKRGKSIKLGPHVTERGLRGRGLGSALREAAIADLKARGMRKVYVDMPVTRPDMLAWDLKRGLRVEAHLAEQYRPGVDEIVMGAFLRPQKYTGFPSTPPPGTVRPDGIRPFDPSDSDALSPLLISGMHASYDEIDQSFSHSIVASTTRSGSLFREKGRFVQIFEVRGRQCGGCAVMVPKRGGALKVGPLVLHPDVDQYAALETLLRALDAEEPFSHFRRVYFVLPLWQSRMISTLLQSNFRLEGVLQSPYREGVDFAVAGRIR